MTSLPASSEIPSSAPQAAYQDTTLPVNARVDDLVSRMTLQEKISQMVYDAPAIEHIDPAPEGGLVPLEESAQQGGPGVVVDEAAAPAAAVGVEGAVGQHGRAGGGVRHAPAVRRLVLGQRAADALRI